MGNKNSSSNRSSSNSSSSNSNSSNSISSQGKGNPKGKPERLSDAFPNDRYKGEDTKKLIATYTEAESRQRTNPAEKTQAFKEMAAFDARTTEHRESMLKEEEQKRQEENDDDDAEFNGRHASTSSTSSTDGTLAKICPSTLAALTENVNVGKLNLELKLHKADRSNPIPDKDLLQNLVKKTNNQQNIIMRLLNDDGFAAFNGDVSFQDLQDIANKNHFDILYGFSVSNMGLTSTKRNIPLRTSTGNTPLSTAGKGDSSSSSSYSTSPSTSSLPSSIPAGSTPLSTTAKGDSSSSSSASSIPDVADIAAEIAVVDVDVLLCLHFLTDAFFPLNENAGSFVRSTITGSFKEGCLQVIERGMRDLVDVEAFATIPAVAVLECTATLHDAHSRGAFAPNEAKSKETDRHQIFLPEDQKKIMLTSDKNIRLAIERMFLISHANKHFVNLNAGISLTEKEMFNWVLSSEDRLPFSSEIMPELLSMIVPIPTIICGSEPRRQFERDFRLSKVFKDIGKTCHPWCFLNGCRYQAAKNDCKRFSDTLLLIADASAIGNSQIAQTMLRESKLLPSFQEASATARGTVTIDRKYNNGRPRKDGQIVWGLMLHVILTKFGTSTVQFVSDCMYKIIQKGCLRGVLETMSREEFDKKFSKNGFNILHHPSPRYGINQYEFRRPVHRQHDERVLKLNHVFEGGAAIGFTGVDFNMGALSYHLKAEEQCRNDVKNMRLVGTNGDKSYKVSLRHRKSNVYYYYDCMMKEINDVSMGTVPGQELNGDDQMFGGNPLYDDELYQYGRNGKWNPISHSYLLHRRSSAQCKRDLDDWVVEECIQNSQIVES